MRLLKVVFSIILIASSAQALDLKSEVTEQRSVISASGEISQFNLKEGDITGSGIKIDFAHNFSQEMKVELYLSTALSAQSSSLQSSFTGLGSYIYYSLLGSCCNLRKNYSVYGTTVMSETVESKNNLEVGVGLDQFFLNGSKAVYSSSGFGAGANYRFHLYDFNLKLSGRYTMLTANNNSASAIFIGLGIVFPL